MKPQWYEATARDELVLDQELLKIAVSEAICEAMSSRGISRAELARRSGITRSALSQRLSGRRAMTLDTLASMLHHLDFRLQVRLADKNAQRVVISPIDQMATWDNREPEPSRAAEAICVW